MPENIFNIGGQVTGSSFIGRKALLDRFRNELITDTKKRVYSLVGLSRSGKTSFVKEVFNCTLPNNYFYHYEDISLDSNFFIIWFNVLSHLREFLESDCEFSDVEQRTVDRLLAKISSIVDVDAEPDIDAGGMAWNRFSESVRTVFRLLNKLSIRGTLVFDEFDRAQEIFRLGTNNFMLFRTVFADAEMNISAVCISRRRMVTIEEKIYQSSTLSNVMIFEPFKGFNKEDMKEYFRIFPERYQIELDEEQRRRIRFYAGNLPYLLAIIGSETVDCCRSGKKANIDLIFKNKCHTINEYYKACLEHLEREDFLCKIIPFVIGPRVGVTLLDASELESIGYLSCKEGDGYTSISEHFRSLLSAKMMELPIWKEIISLERRLKALLCYKLHDIAAKEELIGLSVNEGELAILKLCKFGLKDIGNLTAYLRSSGTPNPTYFSVMSFKQTVRIIAHFWDLCFRKFFNGRDYADFEMRLRKCYTARNPIAHGHEDEFLNDADRNEINSYCNEIFSILSETFPQETAIPSEERSFSSEWK